MKYHSPTVVTGSRSRPQDDHWCHPIVLVKQKMHNIYEHFTLYRSKVTCYVEVGWHTEKIKENDKLNGSSQVYWHNYPQTYCCHLHTWQCYITNCWGDLEDKSMYILLFTFTIKQSVLRSNGWKFQRQRKVQKCEIRSYTYLIIN